MKIEFGKIILSAAFMAGLGIAINSCGKVKETTPTIENSLFGNSATTGLYFVTDDPKTEFKVPVGISAIAAQDRTINFSVSSPTGATEGQQYNLGVSSIKIPAGSSSADVSLKGIFGGYPTGRKDTLLFKITGGDLPVMASSGTYTVVMQKYCDVNLADFSGDYAIQDYTSAGVPDGGPYEVTLTPGAVGADGKTGQISISGLWGVPNLFKVDLNWTNPAAFTTSIGAQPWFIDSRYGQATIRPNGSGTFSSCDNTFKISYEVTVSAGSFGKYYSILTKL